MTIRYPDILDYAFPQGRQSYGPKDCILYALGTGFGRDPLDPDLLRYVYEKDLQVSPSFASVLGENTDWSSDPQLGLTTSGLLHGEEHLVLHHPLPVSGEIRCHTRFSEVFDLGVNRGALLVMDRRIETAKGQLLAELRRIEFARADGGFGGPAPGRGRVELAALAAMPDRKPDRQIVLDIDPAAPLIYRLSGDLIAIHVDPEAARQAGFHRPILHGLSTFGFCCQAVLSAAGYDRARLARIGARFTAPVFGGDRLAINLWALEGRQILFEASVPGRQTTVIRGGYANLREARSWTSKPH
ncbi:MaoC/PaaZ C-terminal domain-containing protein [Paracoccus sp. pheM1]|uniref:MaoC/PaaZ C-terminal domain-containing protein n=1 Tax=Paracoccus sp. pheM1 TaxID=2831675 RepID=UPI001BDB8165|nr:MaoC/PaaZ C-terminal domain-containing protein [Paracoccus sp. pheM1]MBT0782926.1 MaoC family dehydratase N-terminal domain-containing protein [Paracoccus sp. pheM1]